LNEPLVDSDIEELIHENNQSQVSRPQTLKDCWSAESFFRHQNKYDNPFEKCLVL